MTTVETLATALETLATVGVDAGVDAATARGEGTRLAAAVAESARGAAPQWLEITGGAGYEAFFEAAAAARRWRTAPTDRLAALVAAGSPHAAAYGEALAGVALAAADLGDPSPMVRRSAASAARVQRGAAKLPGAARQSSFGAAERFDYAVADPAAGPPFGSPASVPTGFDRPDGLNLPSQFPLPDDLPDGPSLLRSLGLPGFDPTAPSGNRPLDLDTPAPVFGRHRRTEPAAGGGPTGRSPAGTHPSEPNAGPRASGPVADQRPTDSPEATASAEPSTAESPAEPEQPAPTLTELLAQLDGLIGLSSVKREVRQQTEILRVEKLRTAAGLTTPTMTRHMVFLGNPGTGKTTVARLVSGIYRALGLLAKGHLVEVDRSELVAGYLGQTAVKTSEVVAKAIGGVLFIDEAYALAEDQYGAEAVNTLVKDMEDHRSDLVVIVAGYPGPMQDFLATNPGLESRFSVTITFDDYTDDELRQIFDHMARKSDFEPTPECLDRFSALAAEQARTEGFGNGRFARNTLDDAISQHAWRLKDIPEPTIEELRLLLPEDLATDVGTDRRTDAEADGETDAAPAAEGGSESATAGIDAAPDTDAASTAPAAPADAVPNEPDAPPTAPKAAPPAPKVMSIAELLESVPDDDTVPEPPALATDATESDATDDAPQESA